MSVKPRGRERLATDSTLKAGKSLPMAPVGDICIRKDSAAVSCLSASSSLPLSLCLTFIPIVHRQRLSQRRAVPSTFLSGRRRASAFTLKLLKFLPLF